MKFMVNYIILALTNQSVLGHIGVCIIFNRISIRWCIDYFWLNTIYVISTIVFTTWSLQNRFSASSIGMHHNITLPTAAKNNVTLCASLSNVARNVYNNTLTHSNISGGMRRTKCDPCIMICERHDTEEFQSTKNWSHDDKSSIMISMQSRRCDPASTGKMPGSHHEIHSFQSSDTKLRGAYQVVSVFYTYPGSG